MITNPGQLGYGVLARHLDTQWGSTGTRQVADVSMGVKLTKLGLNPGGLPPVPDSP